MGWIGDVFLKSRVWESSESACVEVVTVCIIRDVAWILGFLGTMGWEGYFFFAVFFLKILNLKFSLMIRKILDKFKFKLGGVYRIFG